jgi:putative oxidoreductase
MRTLSLSPLSQLANLAPLAVRVIAGIIMLVHGWQKLTEMGPGNFGGQMVAGLGVPLPVFMGYVVTFLEIIGGILLIIGFLSRLVALLLTIDLVVAILLVKANVGFLSGSSGTGAELDLALIACFLVILFAGPGRVSVDHALSLEPDVVAENPSARRGRTRIT